MKKNNRLLFMLAIVLTAFVGLKNVNADTIFNPDATCGDFPKDGDALVTNCSSSGDESDLFDVTIMTWYKGDKYSSSSTAPGDSVGTTGVYESGYKYYLELKFKPKDGNEFDDDVNFNIIGLSDGTIMNVAPNGEYIVIFEYKVHHIVHFETYGGTPIDDIVVTDGCDFRLPDAPAKDGYTFVDWYLDPDFEDSYYGWCIEESMTLYARFVPTANVIKNINLTLDGPIVGTKVTTTPFVDPEWGYAYEKQDPMPVVNAGAGVHYTIDSAFWVQGICSSELEALDQYPCEERFNGTILANEYYYAAIGVDADENYIISADDLNIKVNGQDPDEVFTVYDHEYTRFVAKVKSKSLDTKITASRDFVDFGYSFPGLENDDYFALAQSVTFTNSGVTTVKLDISNPSDQGFGCKWFDSDEELAPGESMTIELIPHPSYIFSLPVGVHEGVYQITATNADDSNDTYTVSVGAKILLSEKDMSKAAVTGIKAQTYNGKTQRQDNLVVKLSGRTLVKDVDYKVLYSSLTNAGTIKMTIKGIGNYEGSSIVKTFTRNKAKNPLTVKAYNKTVYYSKVKNAAQVVKPIYLSNTKNAGTISYEKLSGSSAKLLLNKTTGKVTVKKGTKKGKYMIKIKVKAAGTTNYKSTYAIRTIYVTVK